MPSPTSSRNNNFSFTNPFDRQRSSDKIPTLATVTPYQPLLADPNAPSAATGPFAPQGAGWRSRAASVFQSFSSNSSASSDRSLEKLAGPGAIQLKSDLARDRAQSVAVRRPSYIPKYAARAHMASMSGRSTMIGSEAEADESLRRGSRMASVSFGAGLPEETSPVEGPSGRVPSVVQEMGEVSVAAH